MPAKTTRTGSLSPRASGRILMRGSASIDRLLVGRARLGRLLDGARISVSVALVVQLVILLIGVPIGAIAGWFSFQPLYDKIVADQPDLLD